jgi:hypothetical protein
VCECQNSTERLFKRTVDACDRANCDPSTHVFSRRRSRGEGAHCNLPHRRGRVRNMGSLEIDLKFGGGSWA